MTLIAEDILSSTSYEHSAKTLVFSYGGNPAGRAAWRGFSDRIAYPGGSDSLLTAPLRHPPVWAPFDPKHRGRHQSRHGPPGCGQALTWGHFGHMALQCKKIPIVCKMHCKHMSVEQLVSRVNSGE